jgi:hypothetical protein
VECRTTGTSSWWRRRRCPLNSSTSRGRRSNPSSALGFPEWPGHRDTNAYTSFPTDSFRLDSWDPRHLRWPTPMSDRLSPRRQTRRLTSANRENRLIRFLSSGAAPLALPVQSSTDGAVGYRSQQECLPEDPSALRYLDIGEQHAHTTGRQSRHRLEKRAGFRCGHRLAG